MNKRIRILYVQKKRLEKEGKIMKDALDHPNNPENHGQLPDRALTSILEDLHSIVS